MLVCAGSAGSAGSASGTELDYEAGSPTYTSVRDVCVYELMLIIIKIPEFGCGFGLCDVQFI